MPSVGPEEHGAIGSEVSCLADNPAFDSLRVPEVGLSFHQEITCDRDWVRDAASRHGDALVGDVVTADHVKVATDYGALARKMKLGGAARPVVIAGPEGLREGLAAANERPIAGALDGSHDWILFFAPDRAALESQLPAAEAALESPGTLWIGYYKGSSKRQTDLTRDVGWDALKDSSLMWLTLISIDDAWSAFSLRKYKPGEARQTFR